MHRDEIKSQIEKLAEEALLIVSSRKITKLVNLSCELLEDSDISIDEIIEDFEKVAGDDIEEWEEFIQALSSFISEQLEEDEESIEDDEE
jgi:hypothetical protein